MLYNDDAENYDDMEMSDLVEHWQTHNGFNRFEGETGVKKLCKLANDLGYSDPMHFGQHEHGSYGNLISFLEDNPGAIDAILDFIGEQNVGEWRENIIDTLPDLDSDSD